MTLELSEPLKFRLGDTWSSPEWAILIDDNPVLLEDDNWNVTCQARRDFDTPVLHEWSTANGGVLLGLVDVTYSDGSPSVQTSTVQILHSAATSQEWDPFSARFEIQIERGSELNIERHTVVAGHMTGTPDVTR